MKTKGLVCLYAVLVGTEANAELFLVGYANASACSDAGTDQRTSGEREGSYNAAGKWGYRREVRKMVLKHAFHFTDQQRTQFGKIST
jgi:hypothetical protein